MLSWDMQNNSPDPIHPLCIPICSMQAIDDPPRIYSLPSPLCYYPILEEASSVNDAWNPVVRFGVSISAPGQPLLYSMSLEQ